MADNKKGFVLYADNKSMIDMLSDEQAGKLMKIIFQYVNDENPVIEDALLKIAFEPIKLQLKRDLKKYEKTKEIKSIGGRMGNLKRWNNDLYVKVVAKSMTLKEAEEVVNTRKLSHTDSKDSLPIAKITDKVKDNVSVNVTGNVKESVTGNDIIDKSIKKEENNFMPIFKKPVSHRKNNFQSFLFELDAPMPEKLKFLDYWTDLTEDGKYMRFELDRCFSIDRRLKTWMENSKNFNSKNTKNGTKRNNKQKSTFLSDSKREYKETSFTD